MDNQFYFVDLPGYGYSKMSKEEQIKCGKFIEEYLKIRQNIVLIILVLDIRHTPTVNDKIMYDYLIRTGRPLIAITNKADKIAITKVDNAVKNLQKQINPIGDVTTLPFSAERKIYKDDVWNIIEQYI